MLVDKAGVVKKIEVPSVFGFQLILVEYLGVSDNFPMNLSCAA